MALLGLTTCTVDHRRAQELVGWLLADPALADEEPAEGPTLSLITGVLAASGAVSEHLALTEAALASARRRGSLLGEGVAGYLLAVPLLVSGRPQEAEATAAAALDVLGDAAWSLVTRAVLAIARHELDDTDAEAVLAEIGRPDDPPLPAAMMLIARGQIRLERGQAAAAAHDAETAGAALGPSRGILLADWASVAARARLAQGERAGALELATENVEAIRPAAAPVVLAYALSTLGLATGGDAGLALLEESVTGLEGTTAPLIRARALLDLGSGLRRSNKRSRAREPLRSALDLARRHDLGRIARVAVEELRATGARPRSELRTGLGGLTASERRVAELVAAGHTNREIATALFITPKTVSTHLTNAYRKLHVEAREELISLVSGDGPPQPESSPSR